MRNDDTEFINKLAFQGWSDEDYEYREDLLKALNKWELETKMNLKLNSLKEDFK